MVARARLRSWSILRWASMLPAWARVVPREEKKRVGGGVMAFRRADQVVESGEVRGWSLGEAG